MHTAITTLVGVTDQLFSGSGILFIAFFAQTLKEIGIPSPGITQSILIYAGMQISCGAFSQGSAIIIAIFTGSLIGASVIFFLAGKYGETVVTRLFRRISYDHAALQRVREKMHASSVLAVCIGRSIPGLMVPTSLVAGSMHFSSMQFLTGVFISVCLWTLVCAGTGGIFGHAIPSVVTFSDIAILMILIVLITASATVFILKRLRVK